MPARKPACTPEEAPLPWWSKAAPEPTLPVPLDDGTPVRLPLKLSHVAVATADAPFDATAMFESGPIHHTLDLVIVHDLLEYDAPRELWHHAGPRADDAARQLLDAWVDRVWTAVEAIPGGLTTSRPEEPDLARPKTARAFARLEIMEFPERVLRTARTTWFEALDANCSQLGELVESYCRRAPDPCVDLGMVNTVYWFQRLGVHPALRGQRVGVGLIAHALWLLLRDEFDIAVCEASPILSPFDPPGTPDPTPRKADRERLAKYYEGAGFARWRRKAGNAGIPVLWCSGGRRLPFDPDE